MSDRRALLSHTEPIRVALRSIKSAHLENPHAGAAAVLASVDEVNAAFAGLAALEAIVVRAALVAVDGEGA